MKYRTLGKTGLRVSVIGVGTWQFGGEWAKDFSQNEADAILKRAGELGINLIDTAECYGDHLSERLIGHAIKAGREKWIIATKFGHRFRSFMDRADERTAKDVEQQLDASLAALQTDCIDIYQYHSVRESEYFDAGVREVLQKAKKAGKIRHIGNSIASNLDPAPQVDDSTNADVEVLQLLYNRLDRRPEKVFESARRQNLGIFARVPLASGFLSGKYHPGARFKDNDFRSTQEDEKIDAKLREVEQIAASEVPPGVDMAQWALAWCLRQPAVHCVIPGCKSVQQVEKNAAAANLVNDASNS